MKKTIPFLLFLCAAPFLLQGQPAGSKSGFGFGPRVGLNLSSLQGKNFSSDSRISYHIGIFGEYRFGNVWACEAALLYSDQGAELKWKDETILGRIELTSQTKLHYLNIPLLAKAYVFEGLHLFAGPQIGFRIGASASGLDVKSLYKPVDVSAVLGIGYRFEMGLNIAVSYNVGLNNIRYATTSRTVTGPGGHEAPIDTRTLRNGVFQVSAGWKF